MKHIINVYFPGTGESFGFARELHDTTVKDEHQQSFYFTGTSTDLRDLGFVFGFYITKQVNALATIIEQIIEQKYPGWGDKLVVLNIFGISRGGIGAMMLANKLRHHAEGLEINLACLDPASGNLSATAITDVLLGTHTTLAGSAADLSACKPLKNVLIIYAHASMRFPNITPGIASMLNSFYRPLSPIFPKHAQVDEDVMPGYHVEFRLGHIAHFRVMEFLHRHGTRFKEAAKIDKTLNQATMLNDYENHKKNLFGSAALTPMTKRPLQLTGSIFFRPDNNRQYVNRHHQRLSLTKENSNDCVYYIEKTHAWLHAPQLRYNIRLMQCILMMYLLFSFYRQYAAEQDNNHEYSERSFGI